MSEVRELVDEIKDRLSAWRFRSRSGQNPVGYDSTESNTDTPEIEFTSIEPFQTAKPRTSLRAFADLTPAWIAAQCAPHIFAQGQQLVTRKQVTRAVAHGGRLTGTTREQHYEDQEIMLQDGVLTASCTCKKRTTAPSSTAASSPTGSSPIPLPARTLACSHVVAVLLAYLQSPPPVIANPAPSRAASAASIKLVCPITRQPLNPNRPMLQCSHCGLCYSPEGWAFLRKEARGRCCNCDARNTVKEVASG